MPQLTEADKQFIRDNWAKLSCNQIAKALGHNKGTIYKAGQRLGLGRKPNPSKVATGEALQARQTNTTQADDSPSHFFDMVDSVFDQLREERRELLERLDQLAALPSDERGTVALEINRTNDALAKCEKSLVDAEELVTETDKYRPKKPGPTDEFSKLDELMEYLTSEPARTTEGHLVAKVRIAADRLAEDWQTNLFQFEDNDVDFVYMGAPLK